MKKCTVAAACNEIMLMAFERLQADIVNTTSHSKKKEG